MYKPKEKLRMLVYSFLGLSLLLSVCPVVLRPISCRRTSRLCFSLMPCYTAPVPAEQVTGLSEDSLLIYLWK